MNKRRNSRNVTVHVAVAVFAIIPLTNIGCGKAENNSSPTEKLRQVAENDKQTKKFPEKTRVDDADAKRKGYLICIAEGVGRNEDEALKDGFRNAVRQAVGALVDAETVVKNDEIISDKILTYSDGFVKSYEELSKKQDNGLIRTKIKAVVERRSVITKLKAAKIAVKDVDGKGLFAEVVTQLEAEKNAAAMVEKLLEGFPHKAMEVQVVGKPEVVERKDSGVKVQITLRYQANKKAYADFINQLQFSLDKIAKDKGEFVMKATSGFGHSPLPSKGYELPQAKHLLPHVVGPPNSRRKEIWQRYVPKAFQERNPFQLVNRPKHVGIAVNTYCSNDGNRTTWNYYILDKSVGLPLEKCYKTTFKVKLSLLNGDGKLLSVDIFPAFDTGRFPVWFSPVSLISSSQAAINRRQEEESLYVVSPLFFERSNLGVVSYYQLLSQKRQLSLSFDELKSVQKIKCELVAQ